MVEMYKTYIDYPNQTGINQIAYPLRDAIPYFNPFFAILLGIFALITVASYYTYITLSGKTRILNSLLASSFVTTIISFFFVLSGFVSPYVTLFFIGMTALNLALVIYYR